MTGEPVPETGSCGEAGFVLALDGYEGPIDLLLARVRAHRFDLAKVSILALADQYLAYLAGERSLSLELAADYLVMAAALAYLKSRLLLPQPEGADEPEDADPADARRRELLQALSLFLMRCPQMGRDVFLRGAPEGLVVRERPSYDLDLHKLLRAYGTGRMRRASAVLRIERRALCAMEEALARLDRWVGGIPEWRDLFNFLPEGGTSALVHRSALAATLAASLELARLGRVELRQDRPFGPIYLRSGRRLAVLREGVAG